AILLTAFDAPGGPWLWAVAVLAAFVTALYSMRMILVVFFGDERADAGRANAQGHGPVHDAEGWNMKLPLAVLAVLSVAGGWFGLAPPGDVLPDGGLHAEHAGWLPWVTGAFPLLGLALGYLLYDPTR